MTVFQATWSVIAGLSLMLVGGLVLWAYGASRAHAITSTNRADFGIETEATRRFHQRLSRWFFIYGSLLIAFGAALLLWAVSGIFDVKGLEP